MCRRFESDPPFKSLNIKIMKVNEIKALPDNVVFFECGYYLVNNELYDHGKKVNPISKKEYLAKNIDYTIQEISRKEEQLLKLDKSIEKLKKIVNNKKLYQKMHDYIANGCVDKDFIIPKPFKDTDDDIILYTPWGTFYYTCRFDIISDLDRLKWYKIEIERDIKKLKEELC